MNKLLALLAKVKGLSRLSAQAWMVAALVGLLVALGVALGFPVQTADAVQWVTDVLHFPPLPTTQP